MINLITEELSISREVEEEVEKIKQQIINTINNEKIGINKIDFVSEFGRYNKMRNVSIKINNPIFGVIDSICCVIYFFDNEIDYKERKKYINIGGHWQYRTITLILPIIGDEIDVIQVEYFLAHELEHVYQAVKSQVFNNDDTYKNCMMYLSNMTIYPIYTIFAANLYYNFCQKELDAKLQEINILIKNYKITEIKGVKKLKVYEDLVSQLDFFNNWKKLQPVYQKESLVSINFKGGITEFINFVESGYEYFYRKVWKMFSSYVVEITTQPVKAKYLMERIMYGKINNL